MKHFGKYYVFCATHHQSLRVCQNVICPRAWTSLKFKQHILSFFRSFDLFGFQCAFDLDKALDICVSCKSRAFLFTGASVFLHNRKSKCPISMTLAFSISVFDLAVCIYSFDAITEISAQTTDSPKHFFWNKALYKKSYKNIKCFFNYRQ